MSKYRGLNGTRLEQIGFNLQTSEELLDAIETVSGELFVYSKRGSNALDNAALKLWRDAHGRENEILAAIPVGSAEEGDVVNWGAGGQFAEFDGRQWIKEENF